jgi:hypothetical protein
MFMSLNRVRRDGLRVAVAALLTIIAAAGASAQSGDTARVFGTVTDESGGVLPGATVAVRNQATGVERSTVSGAEGEYVVPNLPIGTYTVTITLDGFRTHSRDGVTLRVDQQARIDAALGVGQVSEVMTVTAAAPVLESRSGTLRDVVDNQRMVELPINGRNPLELTLLVPGVQVTPATSINTGSTRPGQVNISASGGRGNTIAHALDGGDNSDNYTNVSNVYPNPDALAEFSVQTNNFSPEFGRRLGGVINAITKSGTNAFHGSAFEFFRDESLNASNFFTPDQGDGLNRHQYGGSIGGPIQRDKAFFFGSWQGTRIRQLPVDVTAVVPSAAMRTGDFSNLRNAAGQVVVIRDPLTGLPFPNNQIPVTRFDPTAVRLLQYIPVPGADGVLNVPLINESDDNQVVAKVDYQLGSSSRLTGRYLFDKLTRPNPVIETNLLSGQRTPDFLTHNVQASMTRVLSPRMVGVVAVTYNGLESDFKYGYPVTLRDLGANLVDLSPNKDISIAVPGFFTIPQLGIGPVNRDNLQVQGSLTWVRAAHEVKFGVDLLRQVQDLPGAGFQSNGNFDFANAFTGSNLTDFLLGLPSRFNQATPQVQRLEAFNAGFYVQDNVRVTSRVTLNLGLRYEPYLPWVETANQQTAVWRLGEQSQRAPGLPPNVLVGGDAGVPEAGHEKAWNRFDPRFGFAWLLPGDHSTVRGGFGIFHEFPGSIVNNRITLAPPFAVAINIQNPTSLSSPWTASAPNPYPTTIPPDPSVIFPRPLASTVYADGFTNAYSRQWNLSFEQQFAGTWVGRVSYIGSQIRDLLANREINPAALTPGATLTNINQRRPYFPNYSSVVQFESTGESDYHAVAFSAERRFASNYSVTANYTWSRTRDLGGAVVAGGAGAFYTDPNNPEYDRGRSDFDRPHRFVGTVIWNLPGGGSSNPAVRNLLGRWEISGIFTAQSGPPVNVLAGSDRSLDGVGNDRADQIGDPQLGGDRSRADQITQWFNAAAFQLPALGTFGTAPRNAVRGPAFASLDLSLVKSIGMGPLATQLRLEAFNALNRVNLDVPNGTLSSPLFGRITRALDPRILQLAVRVVF